MHQITLHKGKEISLLRFHPWVFSGAIKSKPAGLADGDLVEVYSHDQKYIGTGHYTDASIAVRMLTFEKEAINQDFWNRRIGKALEYRRFLGLAANEQTNVYRLIFGEGDALPGLIIDFYNGHAVVQCHSVGMHRSLEFIAAALQDVYGSALQTIYDKSREALPKQYASTIDNKYLLGNTGSTQVKEYGHLFLVDWEKGQKTGFFVDQRENRRLLAQYSKGRHVLNTFCYTGGFSVYAGAAGAAAVHSVDASAAAMELTDKNIALNSIPNHTSFTADTFDFLKDKKDAYDVIILDPPAFAKSRDVKHNAVIGYKNLNIAALKQIKSGGLLFTFSCSGVIDRSLFYNTINAAAFESRRKTKILHYLQQPADHPLTPNFPEGEYLKGLVLYVE
jgi:23S rRNA (cytosine1962-C5)-methyltransferase